MILGLFILASCSEAEDSKDEFLTTEESALQMNEVLDRAVEVYGGRDFLANIKNLEIQKSGWRLLLNQSRSPYQNDRYLRTIRSGFQREGDNYYSGADLNDEETSGSLVGVNTNFMFSRIDGESYLRFPPTGIATHGFAPGSNRAKFAVPHLIIEALDINREKAVWVGLETRDGRTYERISYPDGINGYDVFLFDFETGTLTTMERTSQDIALGKVIWTATFGGYYEQDGTVYPKIYDVYFGETHQSHYDFDFIDLDADLGKNDFLPGAGDDFEVVESIDPDPTAVVKYGDNIYGTTGAFDSLFIEFEDYVIVIGLTFNDDWALEQLSFIRETVGDKPVRFAIPTHHHQEHVGGMRTYINEGISIITTSRNRPYFDQVAHADYSLMPDTQARAPKEPVFEIVDDKRVFDDGNVRLELINIGPVGHSEDLYVAWLPNERIVFTADLFSFHTSLPLRVPEKYQALAVNNYQALKKAGIEAKTILQTHGEAISIGDLEKAIFRENQD